MKITIEFKPDCSLQDKLLALEDLKRALSNTEYNVSFMGNMGTFSRSCVYENGNITYTGYYNEINNGYSIQITE